MSDIILSKGEKMNEQALKNVLYYNVLGQCALKVHTQDQIISFINGEISFDSFDLESKEDLSNYYELIKDCYFMETNEFLPNIFYVEVK